MTEKRRRAPAAVTAELLIIMTLLAVIFWLLCDRAQQEEGRDETAYAAEEDAEQAQEEELYMEYGPETGVGIDDSGFVSPETKNNLDLVTYAQQAWYHQWGYVWGTFGGVFSEDLLLTKLAQYPDDVGPYEEFIRQNWLGRRTADCVGLIKSYGWYDPETGEIVYNTNGMPDVTTEDMFAAAAEKGTIDTIPEIPGVIVYCEGHVGIYIGDGCVIEAMSTEAGVVKTKLAQRPFTHWMKCPYITYM